MSPETLTESDPASPDVARLSDAPSPEVKAIYLRPRKGAMNTQPSETLVDSITRIVSGMLEVHIREAVTAAVRALAPRLQVSFPPEAGGAFIQPDGRIEGRLGTDALPAGTRP